MYENDGNMYKAVIFDNPGIRNRMGIMLGGGNIFGRVRYGRVQNQLREVTFETLCVEEGIKTKEEINGILGIQMTDVEYGKLRDCVKHTRKKFKPEWELREIGKNIREWLEPIKKGSKKYRSIMSGRGSRVYKKFRFEDVRPFNTPWTQLEIPLEEKLVSCGMLLWTVREIDTDMRQFMFKWNQGMVHGNTVVSHFFRKLKSKYEGEKKIE
jgi:hypothetical protein